MLHWSCSTWGECVDDLSWIFHDVSLSNPGWITKKRSKTPVAKLPFERMDEGSMSSFFGAKSLGDIAILSFDLEDIPI